MSHLLAVPTQHLRGVAGTPPGRARAIGGLRQRRGADDASPAAGDRRANVRPGTPAAILTGPNFAHEIAAGLPAAAVVAAGDAGLRETVAALLGTPSFRLYGNDDPIGAQVGGAAKNVIAIAAGAVIGAGLGENARAALITRGLAELARLAVALGGRAETVMGLSGLGDLLLTCTGTASRNYSLGPGARTRREACRRAGRAQRGHRGRRHCARPRRARARGGYADLRRSRSRCWPDARRWPRRSPHCWPARGATNDPQRPDRRRLDHGKPHPGLRARHADRGDAWRRPDRRCILRRAEAAQPVPPPVRRGRIQRCVRARLLRHARRRGSSGGTPVRRGDVRRHGVLARRADHRGRAVHAADDGGAGTWLRRDPGEIRARGGDCRESPFPICC